MANHHGDNITTLHAAGVVNRLSFSHGREWETCGVTHRAAEAAKRRAKADTSTRAGFKEEVAQYCAFQDSGNLLTSGDRLHHIGDAKQLFNRLAVCELIYRDELMAPLKGDAIPQWTTLTVLRILLEQSAVLDDLGHKSLYDFGHGPKFLRRFGQQPSIQGAALYADSAGEDIASEVETPHCVPEKDLLRDGHG